MLWKSQFNLLLWPSLTIVGVAGQQQECINDNEGACNTSTSTIQPLAVVECADSDPDCTNWARDGECEFNPEYMLKSCRQVCGVCKLDDVQTRNLIARKVKIREAGGDEKFLETPYGMSQMVFPEMEDFAIDLFRLMSTYMDETVMVDSRYDKIRDRCKNRHRECLKWMWQGECETNRLWMHANCAPACEACLSLDYDHRCPSVQDFASSSMNAVPPGGLNALFERIVNHDFYKQFKPKALSMPQNETRKTDIVDGPWIVVLDDFLTDEECDRLIDLGTEKGYDLSTSLRHGIEHQKRVSSLRTSTNTWCDKGCLKDDVTKRVQGKIVNLTGIPERNAENLQLLRYEPGQQCFVHNDYLDFHKDRQMGVRVLTVFLYLSDVEEGGGTHFPDLKGIAVQPKKGRAVVWPSVRDDNPHDEDDRTVHGSLPVISGIKYGANAFIHQRDARGAYEHGCF